MNENRIFYVYGHFSKDNNSLFYIGKGKEHRKGEKYNRSIVWKRYVAKHGFAGAQILYDNLTEDEAFKIEKELISLYGRIGLGGFLVNLTDGGEGSVGWHPSKETREKMSSVRKGKPLSEKHKLNLTNANKARIGVKYSAEICKASSENRLGKQNVKKNSLGFKGIFKHRGKFAAKLWYFKKGYYLGAFSTPEEAAAAYDRKALELFGPDAVTNFPKENYLNG